MAKTKTTPRKAGHRCSICSERLDTLAEWTQHTIECATKKKESLSFECSECNHATKRKRDLDRHIAKVHPDLKEQNLSDSSSDESGWRTNDPGDLIDEDESLEQATDARENTKASASLEDGRTVRKATDPLPVFPPPRKSVLANQLKRKSVFDLDDSNEPQQGYSGYKSPPRQSKKSKVEDEVSKESSVTEREITTATRTVEIQTERSCKIVHHKRQRIMKYEKDGRQVEEIVTEEWESEHETD